MTKIDETTGLPVLPEGHFWRVRDLANQPPSYIHNDREIMVEIVRTKTNTRTVTENVKHKGTWKTLWFGYTRKEEITVSDPVKEVVENYPLADYELVDKTTAATMGSVWKRSNREYLDVGNIFFHKEYSDKILFVRVYEPTKELILMAAEKALARYNKITEEERLRKEKAEARAVFVGDYPPKKLGLEEA